MDFLLSESLENYEYILKFTIPNSELTYLNRYLKKLKKEYLGSSHNNANLLIKVTGKKLKLMAFEGEKQVKMEFIINVESEFSSENQEFEGLVNLNEFLHEINFKSIYDEDQYLSICIDDNPGIIFQMRRGNRTYNSRVIKLRDIPNSGLFYDDQNKYVSFKVSLKNESIELFNKIMSYFSKISNNYDCKFSIAKHSQQKIKLIIKANSDEGKNQFQVHNEILIEANMEIGEISDELITFNLKYVNTFFKLCDKNDKLKISLLSDDTLLINAFGNIREINLFIPVEFIYNTH